MEGEQPQLGDLLSMVINHLLTGMTLQAHGGLDQKIKNFRLWILIIILPVISQVFRSNLRPRHLLGRREPLRLGGSAAKGLVFSRMSNGFLGGKISGKTEGFLAKRCKTTCHPQIKIQYIYMRYACQCWESAWNPKKVSAWKCQKSLKPAPKKTLAILENVGFDSCLPVSELLGLSIISVRMPVWFLGLSVIVSQCHNLAKS